MGGFLWDIHRESYQCFPTGTPDLAGMAFCLGKEFPRGMRCGVAVPPELKVEDPELKGQKLASDLSEISDYPRWLGVLKILVAIPCIT